MNYSYLSKDNIDVLLELASDYLIRTKVTSDSTSEKNVESALVNLLKSKASLISQERSIAVDSGTTFYSGTTLSNGILSVHPDKKTIHAD